MFAATALMMGVAGASAAAASASWQTSASGDRGPVGAANQGELMLTKSPDNPVVPELDETLPGVSIAEVIADANREGSACRPDVDHLTAAFCWNGGDNDTAAWYTQGTTTTADADPSGSFGGVTALAVTWYDNADDGIDKGARISFVDWSDPSSPTYRHVLLVEPCLDDGGGNANSCSSTVNGDGEPSFQPVNVHAGGVVWRGPYLYLADTANGFRVFDLRRLWEVSTGDNDIVGLQPDGSYHAFDYKYVAGQVFSYDQSTDGAEPVRFSFAGGDRTSDPDGIIVGEYNSEGTGTRLVRYPLDESSDLLRESDDGLVHATETHTVDLPSMQGAVSIDGRFFVSSSAGSGTRGNLVTLEPGGSPTWHEGVYPPGPEDFAYDPASDSIWSNTEYPGNRSVFAFDASAY